MINQKKFAPTVLAQDKKTFVIHVSYLWSKMSIYSAWEAQIILLLVKEISVPEKYANFSDVFFKESVVVLPNCLDINKHVINLESSKQLPYAYIYSLGLLELETFKIYIKINLANQFIWPSKSSIKVLIFFV